MLMLAGQEEDLVFDLMLFTAFVEKVVVSGTKKDARLDYVLMDGSEYKIDGRGDWPRPTMIHEES